MPAAVRTERPRRLDRMVLPLEGTIRALRGVCQDMGVTQQGDEAGARRGMSFSKVKRVRSFDDVVEQVRRSVADGAIGAGERLPSERELAEQFGVSRATLREALR